MTTAVVCGAAALLLPSPCEAAVASGASEPGVTVGPDAIAGQLPDSSGAPSHAITGGARLTEPDPSDDDGDDDDDGDAAPGAPAAAADHWSPSGDSGEGAVMTSDIEVGPLTPLDGHSLRGPPRLESEDTSTDFDDDDDDDDSSECSRSRTFARRIQPHDLFVSHTAPARPRVPDGPQLRAP